MGNQTQSRTTALEQGSLYDLIIIYAGDEDYPVLGAEYIGLYPMWPVAHPDEQLAFHWFYVGDEERSILSVLPENVVSATSRRSVLPREI